MRNQLLSLSAILTSAGLFQLSTAALATAVALQIANTGGTHETVSFVAAAYSIGFLLGCFYASGPIARVGHIRAFCASAAICTIATIAITATTSVYLLFFMRLLTGIATASLFAISEAWINDSTTPGNRARILSVYSIGIGLVSIGSQILLYFYDNELDQLFLLIGCLFAGAIIILAMTDTEAPSQDHAASIDIAQAYRIAPVALTGCFVNGFAVTTLLSIIPFNLTKHGVSAGIIAMTIGALYAGRMLLQLPLGLLSDRMDRRKVIIAASLVSCIIFLVFQTVSPGEGRWISGQDGRLIQVISFVAAMVLGGLLLALYPLLTAHGLDRAQPEQIASLTTSLLFVWALGSIAGPLMTGMAVNMLGDGALVYLIVSALFIHAAITALRMRSVSAPDLDDHVSFSQTPTSSVVLVQTIGEQQADEADKE